MSIKYRKLVRKVNYGGETKEKYNAKILHNNVITKEDFAEIISQSGEMTTPNVIHAIEVFNEHFAKLLAEGHIIDLGNFGRFKPSFESKTCDKLEDVNSKTIKNITCIYKPGKTIRNALKKARLEEDRRYDEHGKYVEKSHSKKKK